MSADKWEALLKQWEHITLTPDTLMTPANEVCTAIFEN